MNFNHFLETINVIKQKPLGGVVAQYKLAPELRIRFDSEKIAVKNPRKAAVLALFYPDKLNNTHFLLTKRAAYKGAHSAQISFPGGKLETTDVSLKHTALRETFEEVGVAQKDISVIKELTDVYIPPSNFLVTPFIGITNKTPIFIKNYEVNATLEVPLAHFLDDNSIGKVAISTTYMKKTMVPCFNLNGHVVWGATAMMLSEIKALFKN